MGGRAASWLAYALALAIMGLGWLLILAYGGIYP